MRLRPDEISIEDLLVADNGDRQHRQERQQRDDCHFFAMRQRSFRGALAFFNNGRIGRKIFPAGEINRQADQHADAGGAETVVPA